jgi:hypothetical protein
MPSASHSTPVTPPEILALLARTLLNEFFSQDGYYKRSQSTQRRQGLAAGELAAHPRDAVRPDLAEEARSVMEANLHGVHLGT